MEIYEKYLNENAKEDIENLIRDNLSGTNRKTTKELLFTLLKSQTKNIKKPLFNNVFDELVADGFLVKTKDNKYTWEM